MRLVRCLLSELDTAGHTYALETPLLLSSDVIPADVELGQRGIVLAGYPSSNNSGSSNSKVLVAEVRLSHANLKSGRRIAIAKTIIVPPQDKL